MATYRTYHMARRKGAIGNYVCTWGEVEADNAWDALEKHRQELWDAGFSTAGGGTEIIENDD